MLNLLSKSMFEIDKLHQHCALLSSSSYISSDRPRSGRDVDLQTGKPHADMNIVTAVPIHTSSARIVARRAYD